MTTATLPSQPSLLKKNLLPGITVATILVVAIMGLSFALHMINIDTIGDANAYYTAAVKSMLVSWKNFFFVAAEPGGSVTVDKPPLGLWIEAVFAYFLGVSGFSVSLPNILAGVFGIPVLYYLVKKYMGELAGLIAALVMALTPVFVATNRNNTMDGLLVFFLLLAAWAFVQATETGKRRWLLIGAFIVGLGFNIKMMQAFLPLPAFYALYFFGSKEGWLRKIINLGIATALLLVVSLSWAVVVDLTPADSRPYIGSSSNNTVMDLIFGHNGISRLESTGGPGGGGPQGGGAPLSGTQDGQGNNQGTQPQQGQRNGPPQEALDACASSSQGASCSFSLPNGNTINGSCIMPPNLSQLACAPANMIPAGQQGQDGQAPNGQAFNGQPPAGGPNGGQGNTPFSGETGTPSVFRFFTQPLSKQMSWLLPFALIAGALALFGARLKLPVEAGVHKAMLIWGGWLLTCVVFFSMVSGIFHAYYAIMLAPALGAVVGIGFAQLWDWGMDKKWAGVALIAISLVTIGFQLFATYQYGEKTLWMIASGLLFGLGVLLMSFQRKLAYITLFAAMLVIPAYWTVMTTASTANQNLPTAYTGNNGQNGRDGIGQNRPDDGATGQPGSNVNSELVSYLDANTQGMEYLVAVPSSQQGSIMVLATGRPVLFMGGFGGQDDVVSAEDLTSLVDGGDLKYVLYGGDRGNKQDISNWLQTSCSVVPEFSTTTSGASAGNQANGQNQPQGPGGGGPNQSMTLYMCQ
jgi:4-amino-4-deoxy-L-arabinose transferase-like glycosyltransferase